MQCNRGLVQVCESYNGTLLLINFIQNAQIRIVRSKQFKSFVVGYQTIPVQPGYVLFTPTFVGVTADLDLTTIAVVDADGALVEAGNDVSIQKMDDTGAYLDVYGYSPEDGGWNIDYEPIDAGVVTFKAGETMCVANNTDDTVYFRVSGAVDLVNNNEVGTGFVLWGNSTPVKIDLTQVQVVDADGALVEAGNDVSIQKMDETGAYLDVYGYSPEDGGWNIDYEPIDAGVVTLEPGEAVCVSNNMDDKVFFKLPCPIKK